MAEENKEKDVQEGPMEFSGDRNDYPEENRAVLDEVIGKSGGQTILFLDGYEGGLVGYCTNESKRLVCIYDYDRSMDFMAKQYQESDSKMFPTYDEAYSGAVEWYEFNTLRSLPYATENGVNIAPVFIQYDEDNPGVYRFISEEPEDDDNEFMGVLPEKSRFTDIVLMVKGPSSGS